MFQTFIVDFHPAQSRLSRVVSIETSTQTELGQSLLHNDVQLQHGGTNGSDLCHYGNYVKLFLLQLVDFQPQQTKRAEEEEQKGQRGEPVHWFCYLSQKS